MSGRNVQMDIAKALGILLVVFYHNWLVSGKKGELYNIILSFNMPLFFFISGIFLKQSRSLASTITIKSDRILKPYFVTLALLSMAHVIMGNADWRKEFFNILYANGSSLRWGQLWFLPHLFAVTIFSWILIHFFKKAKLGDAAKIIILLLMFLAGITFIGFFWQKEVILLNRHFILPGLPFSADIILVTAFFFLTGYYLKDSLLNFQPSVLLTLAALAIFVASHFFFNKTLDLNYRRYDGILIPTIEAFTGIYLTLSIAYALRFNAIIARSFSYIGEASLFILIFHASIQTKTFDLATDFIGKKTTSAAILSFILGSGIPIIIWIIVKKIDFLALFFLPLRSNALFQRKRQHMVHQQPHRL